MDYSDIIKFHGHSCPGLAIGYRMACAGMAELSASRPEDEGLVAIVENNACGVDALQCVSGCTFGKGNLLFRDYGKQVYTLYSRTSKKAVRIVFKGIPEALGNNRAAAAEWILGAPVNEIISVSRVPLPEPEPARIHNSLPCSICGELVMESRLYQISGKNVCIPCSGRQS